jgi:hypothetical protein
MRPHLIAKAKELMTLNKHDDAAKILIIEMSQHVIDIFTIDSRCDDVLSPYANRSIPEIDLSSRYTKNEYKYVTAQITVPSRALERPVVFSLNSKYLNLLGIDRDSATFIEMEEIRLTQKAKGVPWIVEACPMLAPLFTTNEPNVVSKKCVYKRRMAKNELCVELNSGKFIDIFQYTNYCSLENQNRKALVVEMNAVDTNTRRINDKQFHTIPFEKLNATALLYIYALSHALGYINIAG